MEAAVAATSKRIPAPLVTTVITIAVWVAHIYAREGLALAPGAPLRLAITGALIAAFGAHVFVTVRMMRQFDEFTRAVHSAALAFAFPVSMVVMFAIGFLRAEGLLAGLDPRDLAALMLVTYAIGLTWAWRRF
jgi:hypothetical protein